MPTYTFKNLNNITITFKHSIHDAQNLVTRSLKISLKKRGLIEIFNKVINLHEKRKCSFCDGEVNRNNFILAYHEHANGVIVSSGGHPKDKEYGNYHVCINSKCRSTKLNPNSVEFVSGAYRISREEALQVIHSRNSSPFYVENYESNDEYISHQSHSEMSDADRKSAHEKRLSTYYFNKEKFINTYGVDIWKESQQVKDSSSIEYFIKKHGEIEGPQYFLDKIKRTTHFRPNIDAEYSVILKWWNSQYSNFDTTEKFKEECKRRLSRYGLIGQCIVISQVENIDPAAELFFAYGKRVYKIIDLFDYLSIPKEVLKIKNQFHTKMYSYSSIVDGLFFRSDKELSFYLTIKDIVDCNVVSTNRKYDGDNLYFYDMEINYKGETHFIEICSNIDASYVQKMLLKSKKYNAILIVPSKFKQFAYDIENGVDIKTRNYYEYY